MKPPEHAIRSSECNSMAEDCEARVSVRYADMTTSPIESGAEPVALIIGKSLVIKGDLNGSEDLTIEGQVEGTIQLRDHVLIIAANGRVKAQVLAKLVVVFGEVTGNVTASDKVDIRVDGSVDGDIVAPRVAIAEGAHFCGNVDMQRKGAKPSNAAAKPATAAAPTPTPALAAQPAHRERRA